MVKRLLSSLMALCLVITLLPAAALAAEGDVAKIGDVEYATLQYAVNAVPNDGTPTTIELIANVDGGTLAPSDSVVTVATISTGQNIILDLAGYTISATLDTNGNTYGMAQVIRNEGILTVKDSSADGTGKISASTSYGCTATVRNEGENSKLTIESGEISSDGGNAIRNQNGLLTINGGKITTTGQFASFDNGTAAIHNRGDVVINGGYFSTEYQAPMWYGLGADNSTTEINGGTFTSINSGVDIQGGDGAVRVTGGKFHVSPIDYVAPGYYVNQSDSYYVVGSAGTSVTVTTFDQLKNALADTSNTVNITVSGTVTVTEDITVSETACLFIPSGATLAVEDADLMLNGYLINQGTLDVSGIGSGFVNNLIRYVDDGGTITGLPTANHDGVYEIATAAQLQLMHFVMLANGDSSGIFHGDITLENDIDLTGYQFLPLGYDCATAFGGTLDGQGHSITGLTIERSAGDIGLFSVSDSANFKNLTISNASLTTQSGIMGTLVGELYGSSNFMNITVSGTYTNAASYYCGGWIGYMGGSEGDTANFVNCQNTMNVTGCYNVGAFWGSSSGSKTYVTMIDCSNSGNVTATGGTIGIIGGFASNDGILYNFTNTGTITNKDSVVQNPNLFSSKNLTNETLADIIAVRYGADGKTVPYTSLSDAISAAQNGDTIVLLSDITNSDLSTTLNFSINKDIILDGNGHSISGNTALHVGASNQSTTLQNIHFENIHNSTSKLSPVYATGLSGNLTITGCTFVNCDWDAIQATPVAGANIVIQNNYFEITDDAPVKGQRFVHVQSSTNTDFSITVTGNKMLGDTVQEAMGVYYPTDSSKINLSGNYINSSTPLCILTGSGINSAELAYPMANEDMSVNTSAAVLVKDAYYVTAYEALDAALANGAGKTVVLAQNISVNQELSIPDTLTFDANGKTITLEAGGKLTSYLDLSGTVTAASGYQLSTSGNGEDGYTYTVYQVSSGGGSSSSGNKTETVTNPDGSTTTTVTKPDGSTTETTKNPDGSTEVVNTDKNGTVTTTSTDTAGNKTEVVENTDGTSQTTVTNKDGSSSTTKVDQTGKVEAQVKLPASVVNAAAEKGEAVALPMPAVSATSDTESAPAVTVTLPTDTAAKVEIPVEHVTAGTVAMRMLPDGTEEILMDSVITENGVAVTLKTGDTVKIVDNSEDFVDVPDSHWGVDAVDFVTSRELFNGTSATTFTPAGDMTRAMVLTVLARYEGEDTTTGSTWYEAGMDWAVENGISDGTNPMASVTREQLALMLYRYVGSPAISGSLDSFPDTADVSSWAVQGMTWAVENGLITGMGDGTLNPQGTASRVEVATMFMRFIENQNK